MIITDGTECGGGVEGQYIENQSYEVTVPHYTAVVAGLLVLVLATQAALVLLVVVARVPLHHPSRPTLTLNLS